jgi:hypothetical protein
VPAARCQWDVEFHRQCNLRWDFDRDLDIRWCYCPWTLTQRLWD